MARYVLAIDQGTTGSTALVLDQRLSVKAKANVEFRQIFPKPGWVEHDLDDIWTATLKAIATAMRQASIKPAELQAIGITNQRETTLLWDRHSGRPIHNAIVWQDRRTADMCKELKAIGTAMRQASIKPSELQAIGITNQRETTLLWDRHSGRPIHNAIVWQDRRTAELCDQLKAQGKEPWIREKTGLVLDAYFSGTKVRWLLDHVHGAQARAENGDICFGTIDTALLWKLTGGAVHATDVTNASRTLFMDLAT
ncbi:MAG TPA: FGGY family carbohydrate kinase, partial [Myxococcales bacterium]|nr:FGGY family carbohydrate kinase [Myxococcales bacterium]